MAEKDDSRVQSLFLRRAELSNSDEEYVNRIELPPKARIFLLEKLASIE